MDPVYFITFFILLLLSWFFSSTELAIMSTPNHKVESLIREWRFWAKTLKFIKSHSDRLLITILIWNNLVNTTMATLAASISIWLAEASWIEQSLAIWIATWIITFLILMFWEIIPKSFAVKNSIFIALHSAHIYKFLIFILYPIVIIIEIIVKLFTWKSKTHIITDEEIETFIDMWKDSWTLDEEEHEKLINMLDFSDTTVEEVMVPRVNMKAIDWELTVKEAFDFYMENSYSRIPIYTETIDKIDYFFTVRDLIKAKEAWLLDIRIKNLETIKQVIKVPLNQRVDSVLKIFQKSYKHMAIVIDEYWWVAWLVTLEDIIEEVFWEIRDENDRWEADEIRKIWNNSYIIDPSITIDNILDEFNLSFQEIWIEEMEFSWETVSYLITHKLEWFPSLWESIKFCINQINDDIKDCKNEILEIKLTKVNWTTMKEVEVSRKSM